MPYLLIGYPLDELYLGLDDEIDYDSVSSGPQGMVAATHNQSPPAQSDHPGLKIDPALYLGPEDDLININELPDCSDVKSDAPGLAEESMLSRPHQQRFAFDGLGLLTMGVIRTQQMTSDHSKLLGQTLLTNSEKLMQTCGGCKELNG
ncbi:hypothetical protein EV702DRAFT_1049038 [Suillus placidus]|uniref:Uncharacterized protein n=1 Tax=Suillus placidus TaxID=48579 RepID=A0A9P6ZLE2_9AGAM|nr:hypothetical protein EV702DRAFT_1049038 [Suillus placidus]